MGQLNEYTELTGMVAEREGPGDKKWIRCYNGTGATVLNGAVYEVSYLDHADGYYPKILAIAADAVAHCIIGVIENSEGDYPAGIEDHSWGWVQVRGYCAAVTTAASITNEHTAEAKANAAGVASTEGASTPTANTFAIAKETGSGADSVGMYLLGRTNVVIAAT